MMTKTKLAELYELMELKDRAYETITALKPNWTEDYKNKAAECIDTAHNSNALQQVMQTLRLIE